MPDSPSNFDARSTEGVSAGFSASSGSFLKTIIVVHPRERRSKCSVEPLRGRDDFAFFTFPEEVTMPTDNYVRLGMGGPVLSADDADKGLFVLDGTWRLAEKMERRYSEMPVRTLPPIVTAYPRVSKLNYDPTGGLATIEAVYGALKIMNRPVGDLLDSYHWKQQFLELNGWT
ncbi:MAG: DUF367 domain-containing protein [Fuerstiella sp.]